MFRQVHLFAEAVPELRAVSTMVMSFEGETSDYADSGVTISVALNAELRDPINPEKKALGMSLLLRHSGEMWLVEAEVGWTGEQIGWDPLESREVQAVSIEDVFQKAPPLVEWMAAKFKEEVETLSNGSPLAPRREDQP
jgi:hypothetical protein